MNPVARMKHGYATAAMSSRRINSIAKIAIKTKDREITEKTMRETVAAAAEEAAVVAARARIRAIRRKETR